MKRTLLGIVTLAISDFALACSLIQTDPNIGIAWYILQDYKKADLIFTGTVVQQGNLTRQKNNSEFDWQYSTLKVEKYYKGNADGRISFKENITCCLCGVHLQRDERYFVYANNTQSGFKLIKAHSDADAISANLKIVSDISTGKLNPNTARIVDFRKPMFPPSNPTLTEIKQAAGSGVENN